MERIQHGMTDVINADTLLAKLNAGRKVSCYIGFAPTRQIDILFIIPCLKIRELTSMGCNVAILLANVHAQLDENKLSTYVVKLRCTYYELILRRILELLEVDMSRIKFALGSDFQLDGEYIMDVWELSSRVKIETASNAKSNAKEGCTNVGHLLYPIMQAIDENHIGQATFGLQIDMELGSVSQRDIFAFAHKWDQKITYLIHPTIDGLHIDFFDNDALIGEKIHSYDDVTIHGIITHILSPLYGISIDDNKDKVSTRDVCVQYMCDLVAPIRTYLHDPEITVLMQHCW
jgi:tyrosyl-tRNA synthetase